MKFTIRPGTYVVAVSGGVDSVVLLHALTKINGLNLVVAHYDHGIRPDSAQDADLVSHLADRYNLPFYAAEGNLGVDASEALARTKRYEFLHDVQRYSDAIGIITAHHKDDVIETTILNIIRGTGRKGLTNLASNHTIVRPFLGITKSEISMYAQHHRLVWHEDSTNTSIKYRRNYVRHELLPRFSEQDMSQLHGYIQLTRRINNDLDIAVTEVMDRMMTSRGLDRRQFIQLPHMVSKEIMKAWMERSEIRDIDSKLIERLVHAVKTFRHGQSVAVRGKWCLKMDKKYLALTVTER